MRIFKIIVRIIVAIMLTYLLLGLCNWSLNLAQWNGFSRFLLGLILVLAIYSWNDPLDTDKEDKEEKIDSDFSFEGYDK